jgi:hypothetical protein
MAAINLVLILFLSLIRLVVGIALMRTGLKNKMNNLVVLSSYFLLSMLILPFASTASLNTPWIYHVGTALFQLILVVFIYQTFYQMRSPTLPLIFGVLTTAGFIVSVYGNATGNLQIIYFITYPVIILGFAWYAWAGYEGYRAVSTDKFTEDWVKTRYKLIIAYAGFACLNNFFVFLTLSGIWVSITNTLIVVLNGVFVAALTFLAWVMPEGYRKWLNRNYKAPEVHAAFEEEILRQLGM